MELANGFTQQQIAQCISPRRLELTILPTEKCNFRCTYCYEDFELGKMSAHVMEGVRNLISRRAESGLSELTISWFGGEPLLALDVIENICSHGMRLTETHSVAFSGGLTTNGYKLTPDVLGRLVALNQNFFQISLDGWKDAHDVTRLRADGKGTFDVIWANLLAAHQTELDFKISLRVHVTDSNHESLRVLATNIGQVFGEDRRFSVNYQDVRDLGGHGSETIQAISAETFRTITAELEGIIARKGAPVPLPVPVTAAVAVADEDEAQAAPEPLKRRYESAGSRAGYSDETNYICYAAKPNHLLVRSNGRIGKCTVALSDSRNDLGFIRPDGSIQLDDALAKLWSSGLETLDIDKLGCPIAFWKTDPTIQDAIPVRLETPAVAA